MRGPACLCCLLPLCSLCLCTTNGTDLWIPQRFCPGHVSARPACHWLFAADRPRPSSSCFALRSGFAEQGRLFPPGYRLRATGYLGCGRSPRCGYPAPLPKSLGTPGITLAGQFPAPNVGCGWYNSLGGEMALWLGAMDTRIDATACSGFLTTVDNMQKFVSFDDTTAYHAIPYGQSPPICSVSVRAESRWTNTPACIEAFGRGPDYIWEMSVKKDGRPHAR
jgi:hypothetical protein